MTELQRLTLSVPLPPRSGAARPQRRPVVPLEGAMWGWPTATFHGGTVCGVHLQAAETQPRNQEPVAPSSL